MAITEWLHLGDRNTCFFHSEANNKKRRNFIQGIQNEEGIWVEDEDDIESINVGTLRKSSIARILLTWTVCWD